MSLRSDETFLSRINWQRFYNSSGERVPPFGLVRMTGVVSTDRQGSWLLRCTKPNKYAAQYDFFINGPIEVPAGGNGVCAAPFGFLMPLAVDDDKDISAGDLVGPIDGKWTATRVSQGFRVVGARAFEDERNFVLVQANPALSMIGKTTSAHVKDGVGDVQIYYGGGINSFESTGPQDSGHTVSAANRYADLAEDKWVEVRWVEDNLYEIIAGECE